MAGGADAAGEGVSRWGADVADRAQGDDLGDHGSGDRGADDVAAGEIGGARNWDYRYCWLRDSVLALEALLDAGYTDEALAFRDFLLRVSTGTRQRSRSCTGSAASGG